MLNSGKLLSVRDLVKHFPMAGTSWLKTQTVLRAVDGVSFDINTGETLGLVGESGCGKSTTGRLILRLIEATSGQVQFGAVEVLSCKRQEMRNLRKEMQIIFQDPFASLNPKLTVGDIIREPLDIFKAGPATEREGKVKRLMDVVGLSQQQASRYPSEFSGGQRQRVCIARALALNPKLIICDEPVSALDVSIQAQIVNLLKDLQAEFGLTYLFISHDLSVVKHISDRVAVMYLGRIMEIAAKKQLFKEPRHPYTQALLSAIPVPNPKVNKERIILNGDVPSPMNPPSGCRFNTRCPKTREICRNIVPALVDVGAGHMVACHFADPAAIAS
ncbi:MAG TPA: peptide ABC transporter substrate-binding protein [Firmicutes bacterium]|jgi:oligopeptide transport system ATP-binding protein|nr:peptide ABC transporter substrate-binding protein [Bacillota bacterium]